MPSLSQIMSYVSDNREKLVQVDADKNSEEVLNVNVPGIFVPIRRKNIAPENIRYVCAQEMRDKEGKAIYRLVAVKDFKDASGREIKSGTVGGRVDVKTYLQHESPAWVDFNSVVLSSRVFGNSLIANESEISNSVVINSIVDNCLFLQNMKAEDSRLQNVEAEGSCSATGSNVKNSLLFDRVHIDNSTVEDCSLCFTWVSDSILRREKFVGNTVAVEPAKVYNRQSDEDRSPIRGKNVCSLLKSPLWEKLRSKLHR